MLISLSVFAFESSLGTYFLDDEGPERKHRDGTELLAVASRLTPGPDPPATASGSAPSFARSAGSLSRSGLVLFRVIWWIESVPKNMIHEITQNSRTRL
jgi:hypothetical protein